MKKINEQATHKLKRFIFKNGTLIEDGKNGTQANRQQNDRGSQSKKK